MKIAMIEPLGVSQDLISELSKGFVEKGHEFVACHQPLTNEEKTARLADADILMITNGKITEEMIEQSKNLKMISVGFTGIDHLPSKTCKAKNIVVCNSQGYATIPTAELSVSLMLAASRNLLETDRRCRAGQTKAGLIGLELSNKTVGIVGTGMIGRKVAKLLSGFDVNLLGYDVFESEEAKKLGISYVSLDEIFEQSDFISIHLPLLESTRGIVNTRLISKMKDSAILVNCARGPILETQALVRALNEGKIRGAGVDVYEIEPPLPVEHPMFGAKNLITTPHIAFASVESMERRAKTAFDNVYRYLDGKPVNVMRLE